MTWRIWRYEIPISSIDSVHGVVHFDVPQYAVPISVLPKKDSINIYFRVNPEAKKERRAIYIRGTGGAIPQEVGPLIGSVMMPWADDISAYHVFDWNK